MTSETDVRLSRFLTAILDIGGDLQPTPTLRRIVTAACELVDASYGALGVLGPDGEHLIEFVHHGIDNATVERIGHLPEGKGILGLVIRDAKPLRLKNLTEHTEASGFPEHHPPMHSFLGVPIVARDQVFGNLYLCEKRGADEFSPEDEEMTIALAAAAGVAVEHSRLFEQTRRRELRLDALRQITASLLGGEPLDEVLREITRHARELIQADLATIAVPSAVSGMGDHLEIVAADGAHARALTGLVFPTGDSVSGQVIATGRPVFIDDASKDERAHQPVVALGEVGPAMWLPLQSGGETFGTLCIANLARGNLFDDADVDVVRAFADQATVVVEYGTAREQLDRLAIVEERERIARDLHDTVIQRIFATGITLQTIEHALADDTARGRLHDAVDGLDATISDIRNAIFALQSPWAEADVRSRILEIIDGAGNALGFRPAIRFEGPVDSVIPRPLADDLMATLRESLSNVAKHARATRVEIAVRVDDALELVVRDDGVGIPPHAADGGAPTAAGGHGLRNMDERASLRGGQCSVQAGTDGGTVLIWRVPLP